MKDGEERFFVNEKENIHVLGKDAVVFVDNEEIQFDLVTCPHCEGVFLVESYYTDSISSVLHCPFCCLEVGVEDKNTFLSYDIDEE